MTGSTSRDRRGGSTSRELMLHTSTHCFKGQCLDFFCFFFQKNTFIFNVAQVFCFILLWWYLYTYIMLDQMFLQFYFGVVVLSFFKKKKIKTDKTSTLPNCKGPLGPQKSSIIYKLSVST